MGRQRKSFGAYQRGLSLIEMMVGLAVGLIVVLAILTTVATVSVQRRTTVSTNDAQESGRAAISQIETSARLAGAGLFFGGSLMCTSLNSFFNAVTSDGGAFLPVEITNGVSDTITFRYENSPGGPDAAPIVANAGPDAVTYTVARRGRFQPNDLALIGAPGSNAPCTLFQVTGVNNGAAPGTFDLAGARNVPFNPPDDGVYATQPTPTYGTANEPGVVGPSVVLRIGNLVGETYGVLCNTLVRYDATAVPACDDGPSSIANATSLASEVVMIQAQYGVTNAANLDVVTNWVDDTPPDIGTIKAVRIVVVARSAEPAAGQVTQACTNLAGVVNTGPCSFADLEAPVIDLSTVAFPAGRTWQNYRYRVYQSVIPLRNVLWNL